MPADKKIQSNCSTGANDEPPAKEHDLSSPVAAAISAFASDYKAEQAKNSEHNDAVQTWTRRGAIAAGIYTVLTLLILVATAYSAWQSRLSVNEAHVQALEATRQADIAEKEMLANSRPWMSPFFQIDSLEIRGTGAVAHFTLLIKNTGRVPIFNPFTNATIDVRPQFGIQAIGQYLQGFCETTIRQMWSSGRSGGTQVPPDEKWPQHRDVEIYKDKPWSDLIPSGRSTFVLYGCLTYELPGGAIDTHQTSFIYELGMKVPSDDVSIGDIDLTHSHIIKGEDLRLKHEYLYTRSN